MVESRTPNISLTVAGNDLSGSVLSLTVVHELGRIPFLRASLSPGDAIPSLTPGAKVEFEAGYDDKLKPFFKGILVSVGLQLSGGVRYLRLEARDRFHLLTLGHKTRLFIAKSDDKICKEIISDYGLSANIPAALPEHKQFQQLNANDWEFVLARLRANSMVPLVKDGQLKGLELSELGSSSPVEIDAEKEPLLDIEIVCDNRAWFDSVKVRCWDESTQQEVSQQADTADPTFLGCFEGSGESIQEILVPYAVEPDEMENIGQGLLWRLRQGFICGRICLAGLAGVEPGQVVEVKNCLDEMDGQAVIQSSRLEIRAGECRHNLQFGYDFLSEFCRDESDRWLGGRPAALGVYPAQVVKLSEDPDNGERLKVHIPLLHKDDEAVWARSMSLYAGPEHAMVFRPEKDDEVLVGFLGGDPAVPVVLGSLFSKAAPAPEELKAEDEKNSYKGWISKSGLKLLLNEEDKSISFLTPGEQSLVIDDKAGSITLKDKNNNSLIMDKNGITLKSGKDISLEATGNIKIRATQNLKGEGLNVELAGQKGLKVAGQAMAEISASGILTVKGAMVKIN